MEVASKIDNNYLVKLFYVNVIIIAVRSIIQTLISTFLLYMIGINERFSMTT